MNLDDLADLARKCREKREDGLPEIRVCMAASCQSSGATAVHDALAGQAAARPEGVAQLREGDPGEGRRRQLAGPQIAQEILLEPADADVEGLLEGLLGILAGGEAQEEVGGALETDAAYRLRQHSSERGEWVRIRRAGVGTLPNSA